MKLSVKILFILILAIIGLFIINGYNETEATTSTNTNTNINTVNTGIWVHSGEMDLINLDSVQKQKINNIYLHSNIIKKYNNKQIQDFITQCHKKNIKVHIWVSVFRYDDTFHEPNTLIVYQRLNFIKECANIPNIDGITLDYIRYDGKNPSTVKEQIITDFVKEAHKITQNKNIQLSACIMPEKDQSAKLYGQNIQELSKHAEVMMPMIYKGNYGKNTAWITETTKWYKKESQCQVIPIILTYKSDKDTSTLSNTELKTDIKSVYDGGADGCSLFKYGFVDVIS